MNLREHMPLVEPPERVWNEIEAAIQKRRPEGPPQAMGLPHFWIAAAAAAAAILIGIAVWPRWTTLQVGNIGTVSIAPYSRFHVEVDRADQHRIRLDRGKIIAKITAPPRLFFVDTKSGTAIDLGCEYALNMDEDGSGLLHVTRGWVEFTDHGRESLVPAGAFCKITKTRGPDLPYFDDAPPGFIDGPIDKMLQTARVRDTLTLWHLLSRVAPQDRARVLDRIDALTPIPSNISRESLLALDANALTQLREELAWKW